jgi:hypothetical protein
MSNNIIYTYLANKFELYVGNFISHDKLTVYTLLYKKGYRIGQLFETLTHKFIVVIGYHVLWLDISKGVVLTKTFADTVISDTVVWQWIVESIQRPFRHEIY